MNNLWYNKARVAVPIIIGLVIVAVVSTALARPGQTSATPSARAYDPFEMVYLQTEEWGEQEIQLMWWSVNEWTARLVSSTSAPEHVGRTVVHRFGSQAILDPVFGDELLLNVSTPDVPGAPNEWLVPRDFAASTHWKDAGLDDDGNQQWRRTDDSSVTSTYAVDPDTGLVVRGEDEVDGVITSAFRVIELAPLDGPAPPLPEITNVTDLGEPEPAPTETLDQGGR